MQTKSVLVFAVLASSALFACGNNDNSNNTTATVPNGPGDFQPDYKTSSLFLTNMSAPVKGTSPHGTVRIWYSSNLKDLLSKDAFTAPEGTTIIKEFDVLGDGTQTGLAVMLKKPKGYDAANGDWYYDMRDTAGTVMPDPPAGKIAMCIGCHGGYQATDYLAGTKLR